ncbi:hypothetical protein HYH02_012205 [Chlamydomonas schloesseri]|uniref:Nuclear control of ATPase protein 2 n=1 Tax=Chlamydomonas schloesseri TaxID=2026947 RepID=A0A835T269_9CHLO|nr:hypothetical protein HYH02_012205 [Chlamydomonas schloesseri]|eukprot:KAG2434538.1 hypothetical protein HYH02_012205 [Chlamydomonas schloesseri]
MSLQDVLRAGLEEVAELARESLRNVQVVDFHPALWITPVSLPAGGLDVVTAQDLLYSLRSLEEEASAAAGCPPQHGRPETPVADAWLRAVQCAQLAQDRLLSDLHDVERNLGFWQQQVAAGGGWSHATFLLLARGPASFAADVAAGARQAHAALRRYRQHLQQQLANAAAAAAAATAAAARGPQQRQQLAVAVTEVGEPGQEGSRAAPAEGGSSEAAGAAGAAGAGGGATASATDSMQQRVLLLRALQSRLATALARVNEAAESLHLQAAAFLHGGSSNLSSSAVGGSSAGASASGPSATLLLSPAARLPVGFAASGSFSASAAAAAAARGPSFAAGRRAQAVSGVEGSVLAAVRAMRAALEELLAQAEVEAEVEVEQGGGGGPEGPAGGAAATPAPRQQQQDPKQQQQQQQDPKQQQQQQQDPKQQQQQQELSAELRALLDVLRLRPLAARAVEHHPLVPPPPGPSEPGQQQEGQQQEEEGQEGQGGRGGQGASSSSSAAAAVAAEVLELSGGGRTARAALGAARRAAALSGPLAPLPPSARMPSAFQRHWLRYAAAGGLLLYGGLWLLRHSRLAGSGDLDRWAASAAAGLRAAVTSHLLEPLAALRTELFATFRDRPDIVSASDFAASRDSLLRMLADFAADHGSSSSGSKGGSSSSGGPSSSSSSSGLDGGGGGGSGDDGAVAAGMGLVMRAYEEQMRRPLTSLVLGDLGRALLIQVQHVKVDGEAAMLRLDQILRANELTVSLMAALPALGLTLAAAAAVARLLLPRPPNPRAEAVPSRLAMAALEVALEDWAEAEERRAVLAAAVAAAAAADGKEAASTAAAAAQEAEVTSAAVVEELRGLAVYRTHRVYLALTRLFATADRTSRYSEWRLLQADLLRLAAPGAGPRERLATHGRMMRTYSVFQR